MDFKIYPEQNVHNSLSSRDEFAQNGWHAVKRLSTDETIKLARVFPVA